jgi:hypothetical protein
VLVFRELAPGMTRTGLRRYTDPASMSVTGKNDRAVPPAGEALTKEVCRRIRLARSHWDRHDNAACRRERTRALALYDTLTKTEKEQIPQVLRVWLRYRSEKYFNDSRTPPGGARRK